MKTQSYDEPGPPSTIDVLDAYFIENRAKLLDLAAFLDRIDRARTSEIMDDDHRLAAIITGLKIVSDGTPDRARRLLEIWSDPTVEPIAKASTKGATGAWKRSE